MTHWEYSPPPADQTRVLRKSLRVGQTVAELLARLGFSSAEEAEEFLHPRLKTILCPFEIPNLEAAARRISQAIDNRQRIVICGDYDVDGVTSTALLVAILQRFDNFPAYIVPLRLEEGYGLSQKAAERALDKANAPDLFIALDCGTNSVEEAQYILDTGCDLIIVDHHQSKRALPDKALLVNPHVSDREDGRHRQLCSVGLVFKLAHGILKTRRALGDARAFEIRLRNYLDLVSMGTVADMVPLRRENRAFARIGLQVLAKTKREGLRSLMKVSGIVADHGVNPVDVSFKIGPRINASGRLADASVAVELILSDDPAFSLETALQLDSFNRERQDIERAMTEQAIAQISAGSPDRCGLVAFDETWHPGVVGIVASRVSRTYARPAIVLGREGDLAKGSGRSVDGLDLVEILSGYADKLASWGGHPMAVGISMPLEQVEDFAKYFDQAIRDFLRARRAEGRIEISAWIGIEDIDTAFMRELSLLEPFGQENPEPIFATKGARFLPKFTVFKDAHFRFCLRDAKGRTLVGVAWKMADRMPPAGVPVDIAYRLAWNTFGRKRAIQLELVDWRLSAEARLDS